MIAFKAERDAIFKALSFAFLKMFKHGSIKS
jgi:hypothetical protein